MEWPGIGILTRSVPAQGFRGQALHGARGGVARRKGMSRHRLTAKKVTQVGLIDRVRGQLMASLTAAGT